MISVLSVYFTSILSFDENNVLDINGAINEEVLSICTPEKNIEWKWWILEIMESLILLCQEQ